jgi:hypothetical protein
MQAAGLIDAWARQELAEHTPAAGAIHLVGIDGVFAADGSRIGRIEGAVGCQDREIEIEEQRQICVVLLGMLDPCRVARMRSATLAMRPAGRPSAVNLSRASVALSASLSERVGT